MATPGGTATGAKARPDPPEETAVALWVLWGADEIPVTHLFDDEREETPDLKHAVTFVAGPLPTGQWLSGFVVDHPELRKH
jgi:hypothetical protein